MDEVINDEREIKEGEEEMIVEGGVERMRREKIVMKKDEREL